MVIHNIHNHDIKIKDLGQAYLINLGILKRLREYIYIYIVLVLIRFSWNKYQSVPQNKSREKNFVTSDEDDFVFDKEICINKN